MSQQRTLLTNIALHLLREQKHRHSVSEHALRNVPASQLRLFIRESLTTRAPERAIESLFELVDKLLEFELDKRVVIQASDIPPVAEQGPLSRIALFHGDITTLAIDVIVNAANTAMLGCFQPTHKCIDNIIHDHAGPRLRIACFQVRPDSFGDRLPTGKSFITPGFALPAAYVSHTVGPQLRRGSKPSAKDQADLNSCYTTTLDETLHKLGPTSKASVAFPCISTGLFGYPADQATPIAVKTVLKWLEEHPQLDWKVIFNTFLPSDAQLYRSTIVSLYGVNPSAPVSSTSATLQSAAQLIRDADYLLVTAGAGLSAAAGLDYTSEEVFAKHHMPMVRQGYRNMYEFIGHTDWTEALQWGYLFAQANLARFNWKPTAPVYTLVKQLVEAKASFIQTSNADGMFEQQGFPKDKIYTVQGDYSRIQCLRRCRDTSVWDIKPFMERGLACQDPDTYELTDPSAIPRCPNCGSELMLNVRGGDWFIEEVHEPQRRAFDAWLANALNAVETQKKKLVVLEIGAGFNTPGVLRFPNEELAEMDNVALVRLNMQYEEVPLTSNGIGIKEDATKALQAIVDVALAK
ncbi:hypothetical protein AC1031_000984 [Aphanomyces cochlioides]|nr:hypothetical protein AC1031_000984 [Aphanomyces cochlioides]